jgi:hypothetical protein
MGRNNQDRKSHNLGYQLFHGLPKQLTSQLVASSHKQPTYLFHINHTLHEVSPQGSPYLDAPQAEDSDDGTDIDTKAMENLPSYLTDVLLNISVPGKAAIAASTSPYVPPHCGDISAMGTGLVLLTLHTSLPHTYAQCAHCN